jgi:DNA invertase Pin-like site-specific DNA recombinase
MKLIAYLRVSTEKQANSDRYGLETQTVDIQKWCTDNGHKVIGLGEYTDKVSGATYADDRPALVAAIRKACEIGADGLVAGKRDRFGRGAEWIGVLRYLLKQNWEREERGGDPPDLYSADGVGTDDDIGSMVYRSAMDMFAAIERIIIRNRLQGGRRASMINHGHHGGGGLPYGYTTGEIRGVLAIEESEAEAVRMVFTLRNKGMTLMEICGWLTQHGYTTKNGGPWRHSAVQNILRRRKFYEATALLHDVTLGSGVTPAHKPIIVSGEQ